MTSYNTIPASEIVSVQPNVLAAGGIGLNLTAVIVTESTRAPIGEVVSFARASDVAAYFGPASVQAAMSAVYFQGFSTSTVKPGSLGFWQYTPAAVAAYLRGGNVANSLTVAQLAALAPNTLTVVMDGYTHTSGSINLSATTSYSGAATTINSAFSTEPTEASVTASIGGTFATSTTTGTVLTMGALTTGSLQVGDVISGTDGTNSLPAGCYIVNQLTGTSGGSAGATFTISAAATPSDLGSATVTSLSTVMDVTVVSSGALAVGLRLSGSGIGSGTNILSQISGDTGSTGLYGVSAAQTVSSTTVTAKAQAFTVTFDSVSGAFVFTSGLVGSESEASFATSVDATASACTTTAKVLTIGGTVTGTFQIGDVVSGTDGSHPLAANTTIVNQLTGTPGGAGTYTISAAATGGNLTSAVVTSTGPSGTLAAALLLTSATGAVTSQGAAAMTPSASMNALTAVTTNFGSFLTDFDPDGGSGNAQKLLFAEWNGLQDDEFCYICWDTDAAPTTVNSAPSSLGQLLKTDAISGTTLIWEPTAGEGTYFYAAFLAGAIASVNFQATNGRITFKFKGQSGLVPSVTSATVAANLDANGYNFYAVYATAAEQFTFFGNGRISGPFNWLDAYVNQIWLNAQIQLALMVFITTINSVPYTPAGDAMIENVITGSPATPLAPATGPITAALNFGAIDVGVPLSSAQAVEVNAAAGIPIAGILSAVGYYVQVLTASPDVRAARGSPPINVWYTDGGAVQLLSVNSVAVQ